MQVHENISDGLKRELKVTVPAADLGRQMEAKLDELKDKVQIKGFRPGKVPVAHLRRVYGRSVMAEVVQTAVTESSKQALDERKERPAFQPNIKLTEDEKEIEQLIAGKADLAYTMSFEVMPVIPVTDLKVLKLERMKAEVSEADIQKSIDNIVKSNMNFEAEADRVAADGDRLMIDFVGKLDGEPFEGGTAEDAQLIIGQGQFIPGFEEQLIGAKAGDEKAINITFPDPYQAPHLAGKPAVFEIKVKEVAKPAAPEVNDEFAKTLGLDSLQELKDAISKRLGQEFEAAARGKLKRELLDALDATHSFDLPPTLVEQEHQDILRQAAPQHDHDHDHDHHDHDHDHEHHDHDHDHAHGVDAIPEEKKAEYRKLAERRVRLGLLLSEIGEKNDIRVQDEEVNRAIVEQARRYPGQESAVIEYFRKTPQAQMQLRAPIFEEKVVDFVLELAQVTDRAVASDELFKDDEEDEAKA